MYNETYEYRGKKYTMKELSKLSGLRYSVIQNRIANNWDIDDVVTKPLKKPRKYMYKGEYYTVKELSEMCGITTKLIHDRLRKGLPIEEVLKKPKKRIPKEPVEIKPKFYFSEEEKERLQKMDWDKFEKNFKSKPYLGDITRLTR